MFLEDYSYNKFSKFHLNKYLIIYYIIIRKKKKTLNFGILNSKVIENLNIYYLIKESVPNGFY